MYYRDINLAPSDGQPDDRAHPQQYTHPAIAEVQVFGVPDPVMGEEVCAWIQLRHGASLTEDALKSFCRDRISRFKIPRYVRFVEEYPMTVTGKIQKFVIRETMTKELAASD